MSTPFFKKIFRMQLSEIQIHYTFSRTSSNFQVPSLATSETWESPAKLQTEKETILSVISFLIKTRHKGGKHYFEEALDFQNINIQLFTAKILQFKSSNLSSNLCESAAKLRVDESNTRRRIYHEQVSEKDF